MSKIDGIKQETSHPYLNMFSLDVVHRDGSRGKYYLASRTTEPEGLELSTGRQRVNGVNIFSIYGEDRDRVVLVRQFRFTIGTYIYELPAGLVEEGEDFHDTAVRELKEETGLTLHPLRADDAFERPFYTTVGMTDENCATVYGFAEGSVSSDYLEGSEDIEVVLADRQEVRRILREEKVALACAYMLMHFLADQKPFDFLKTAGQEKEPAAGGGEQ